MDLKFWGKGNKYSALSDDDANSPPQLTIDDKRWLARAQNLRFEQLANVRVAAEKWRNALLSLTALLTAVGVIKGTQTASELDAGRRWIVGVLLLVAFVILLGGSLFAMRASFGQPDEKILLDGMGLRRWEADETRLSVSMLRLAQYSLVSGIVAIAAASVVAYTNNKPDKEPTPVRVTADGTELCGSLIVADHGQVLVIESLGAGMK